MVIFSLHISYPFVGEEVSKSTPKIESEDDEAATINKNGEHSNIGLII